jgi:hypothetical protein
MFKLKKKIGIKYLLLSNECSFHLNAFLIKIRKTGRHEMDNKFLTQTFRHSFLQLYCGLTYQLYEKIVLSNLIQ